MRFWGYKALFMFLFDLNWALPHSNKQPDDKWHDKWGKSMQRVLTVLCDASSVAWDGHEAFSYWAKLLLGGGSSQWGLQHTTHIPNPAHHISRLSLSTLKDLKSRLKTIDRVYRWILSLKGQGHSHGHAWSPLSYSAWLKVATLVSNDELNRHEWRRTGLHEASTTIECHKVMMRVSAYKAHFSHLQLFLPT